MEEDKQISGIEISSTTPKIINNVYEERKIITNLKGIDKYIKMFIDRISSIDEYLTDGYEKIKYSDIFHFLNLCMLPDTTWLIVKYKDIRESYGYFDILSSRSVPILFVNENTCIDSVGKMTIQFHMPYSACFVQINIYLQTERGDKYLLTRIL